MRRGPKASTSMPITIRVGMVRATLRISSTLTSWSLSPRAPRIEDIIGAWLNHT